MKKILKALRIKNFDHLNIQFISSDEPNSFPMLTGNLYTRGEVVNDSVYTNLARVIDGDIITEYLKDILNLETHPLISEFLTIDDTRLNNLKQYCINNNFETSTFDYDIKKHLEHHIYFEIPCVPGTIESELNKLSKSI